MLYFRNADPGFHNSDDLGSCFERTGTSWERSMEYSYRVFGNTQVSKK